MRGSTEESNSYIINAGIDDNSNKRNIGDNVGVVLNKIAREQMKYKLLKDIRIDIEVCKLEGLNAKEYLIELKEMIDSLIFEVVNNTRL